MASAYNEFTVLKAICCLQFLWFRSNTSSSRVQSLNTTLKWDCNLNFSHFHQLHPLSSPFKQVSHLERYYIITTKLLPHLVKMQKSHLRTAHLWEELLVAILHYGFKWISKCLHTYYCVFMWRAISLR